MVDEALLEIQERWKVELETCQVQCDQQHDCSRGGRRMSKITYWKCVDCNSMINDENMHENADRYAEFCYGCMNYNTEVVLAYD